MQRLGRVIGNVFAVMLAVYSLQAMAEAQLAGRDFNHAATGFPLTGGHATAACETCHVAGVFKGTAKTCDGCHALGKRVVATPMPTTHIVTDAPCDTCHFNASTFLGARFNHGTALPGQCATCHNGRQSMGKPASHSSGNKAIKSCDQCHRSFTWFQASWNHTGVAIGSHSCMQPGGGCHSDIGNQYTSATAVSPVNHNLYVDTKQQCDVCHLSFVVWNVTMHEPQTGTCSSCHNGTTAIGPATGHTSFVGWPTECSNCHHSTVSWLGAGFHSGNEAGQCRNCHANTSSPAHPASHNAVGYTSLSCDVCHNSQTTWGSGTVSRSIGHRSLVLPNVPQCTDCHSGHHSGTDCSASSCHKPAGNTGKSFSSWN